MEISDCVTIVPKTNRHSTKVISGLGLIKMARPVNGDRDKDDYDGKNWDAGGKVWVWGCIDQGCEGERLINCLRLSGNLPPSPPPSLGHLQPTPKRQKCG